jgi:hypothetical protein
MSADPEAPRTSRRNAVVRALERRGSALLLFVLLLWILWQWLKPLVWSPS